MQAFSRFALPGLVVLAVLCALLPESDAAERTREKKPARHACPIQKPQKFLIRSSFVIHGSLNEAAHERALRYRAERYGNVEGFGLERYNKEKAYSSAVSVRFMGLPLQIHKKVAPALRCVEHYIRHTCTGPHERYVPRAVGGFRQANTYRLRTDLFRRMTFQRAAAKTSSASGRGVQQSTGERPLGKP